MRLRSFSLQVVSDTHLSATVTSNTVLYPTHPMIQPIFVALPSGIIKNDEITNISLLEKTVFHEFQGKKHRLTRAEKIPLLRRGIFSALVRVRNMCYATFCQCLHQEWVGCVGCCIRAEASAMYMHNVAMSGVTVRPSVCLSVTHWYLGSCDRVTLVGPYFK